MISFDFVMKKIVFYLLLFFVSVANAQNWKDVGGGIRGNDPFNTEVNTLFSDSINSFLYAGGFFDSAGQVSSHNIAQWDGVNWHSMNGGLNFLVEAITVCNNVVYAGGENNKVWKWSGFGWSSLPAFNSGSEIRALGVWNGELYAGGSFTYQNGHFLRGIAKWNGVSWDSLSSGTYTDFSSFSEVESITEYQGNLVVGGLFWNAGGVSAYNIAMWDGTNWSSFGAGMSGSSNQFGDAAFALLQMEIICTQEVNFLLQEVLMYMELQNGTE